MRLVEFASAEEQMALWRLVSDSVKRPVRSKIAAPKAVPLTPIQAPKPIQTVQKAQPIQQPKQSIGSTGAQTAGSNSSTNGLAGTTTGIA